MRFSSLIQELPDELNRRLIVAREQVVAESMPLRFRYIMSILAMFGPKWRMPDDEQEILKIRQSGDEAVLASVRGWQRRAWNAVLCLEKVAPLWDSHALPLDCFADKDDVATLVSLNLPAEIQKMKGEVLNVLPHEYLYIYPLTDNVISCIWYKGYQDIAQNRAAHTLQTAEHVFNVVAADEPHQYDPALNYPLDWDGEPYGVLSAEWSSTAYSIVRYDHQCQRFEEDPERLREFWLWWLDEAVPASWYLRDLS